MNYNQRVALRQSASPDEGESDFVVNQLELFFFYRRTVCPIRGNIARDMDNILQAVIYSHYQYIYMRSQTSHTPTDTRAFLLIQPFLTRNCSTNVSVTFNAWK